MIQALHALIYSDDPAATRAFFKDVLRLPFVSEAETSEPSDWLIFRSGPSEFGVHPATGPAGEQWAPPGQHQVSLVCDDIAATVAELAARGAQLDGEPRDMRFGIGVGLHVPGAVDVLLYEPRHVLAYDLPAGGD
ncbi:MAG: VOC family protein [Marmoricola sp.]|nr:VOC family protein [Marmoricola sp.]